MEPDTKGNVLDIEVSCISKNKFVKKLFPDFEPFRCKNAAVHDNQVCPSAQVLQNNLGGRPNTLQRNHGNRRQRRKRKSNDFIL